MIEPWVLEKLNPIRREPLIILRDPQRMIRRGDRAVDGWAGEAGLSVLRVSGNLGLRTCTRRSATSRPGVSWSQTVESLGVRPSFELTRNSV